MLLALNFFLKCDNLRQLLWLGAEGVLKIPSTHSFYVSSRRPDEKTRCAQSFIQFRTEGNGWSDVPVPMTFYDSLLRKVSIDDPNRIPRTRTLLLVVAKEKTKTTTTRWQLTAAIFTWTCPPPNHKLKRFTLMLYQFEPKQRTRN